MRPTRRVNLEDLISKENTPEFDYFLGILATDGCICNKIISLEFSEENKEILDYWNEFLGGNCRINLHKNKKSGKISYKISFMNKEICEYLKNFGITERKSFSLKLKYINWNVLLGVFDGDGSLTLDSRHGKSWRFKIATASLDFA